MMLPDGLSRVLGVTLMLIGTFGAYTAAFAQQNAEGMIGSIVIAFVGLWFLLVKIASSGATSDVEHFIRRMFVMMGVLVAVIIATLYLGDSKLVAAANLVLMAAGLWLTTNYLHYLDRGR